LNRPHSDAFLWWETSRSEAELMRPILLPLLALLIGASPALAKNDKHDVPPGLAKKPGGLPPGQAKKLWARGERLPRPYYVETRYVIVQPQRYRLPPPPFGYRWVDVNGDAYLVQTRTGLITDLVLDVLHR
jgi:hypothetical protein